MDTRIERLEAALGRLVDLHSHTEVAVARLLEAQAGTEERLGRLEEAVSTLTEGQRQLFEAQARTEARLEQLAAAQARTEATLQATQQAVQHLTQRVDDLSAAMLHLTRRVDDLSAAVQQLTRQVGGLSETVGGDIEDIAYIVLHEVLAREFGWQVGVLERTWQEWDGEAEEVNIFGRATDPARVDQTIWIVGEAKHNLTLGQVDRFALQVDRARHHLRGELYAVCFAYRVRPEVRSRLKELGIPLIFSYGRFA